MGLQCGFGSLTVGLSFSVLTDTVTDGRISTMAKTALCNASRGKNGHSKNARNGGNCPSAPVPLVTLDYCVKI